MLVHQPEQGMVVRHRRRLIALCLAGVLLTLFAWAGCFRYQTAAGIDRMLRSHIRTGASVEQVQAVLDSLDIDHGPYEPSHHLIQATWSRAWVGLVSEADIVGMFYFDESRRLTRYEVEEHVRSL
jgi:hypothetical protein